MSKPPEPTDAPRLEQILKVDSRIFLFVPTRTGETKLPATLLGWRVGDFMLVNWPTSPEGYPVHLEPGQELVLRYLLDGDIYGMRTNVLRLLDQPAPLLFLKFPREIENVPLRSRPRVNVRLPTVANWLPGSGPPEGVTFGYMRDVTPEGGLLELTLPEGSQPKGRSVHLSFLVGQNDEIEVNAQVKNITMDGVVYRLGVSFIWKDDGERERVEVFCRLH